MNVENNNHSIQNFYKSRQSKELLSCLSYFFDEGECINIDQIIQEVFQGKTEAVFFVTLIDAVSYVLQVDKFQNIVMRLYGIRGECILDSYDDLLKCRTGICTVLSESYKAAMNALIKYPLTTALILGQATDSEIFFRDILRCTLDIKSKMGIADFCGIATAHNLSVLHCITGNDGYSINYIKKA